MQTLADLTFGAFATLQTIEYHTDRGWCDVNGLDDVVRVPELACATGSSS